MNRIAFEYYCSFSDTWVPVYLSVEMRRDTIRGIRNRYEREGFIVRG